MKTIKNFFRKLKNYLSSDYLRSPTDMGIPYGKKEKIEEI